VAVAVADADADTAEGCAEVAEARYKARKKRPEINPDIEINHQ
jgi:hypothetical protein